MSKSFEINRSTLMTVGAVVFCFSALIYFINSYDKSKKLEKLKTSIADISGSPVLKELSGILDTINLEQIYEEDVTKLKSYLNELDEQFYQFYRYGMRIIIKTNEGYSILSTRNRMLVKHASLADEKTERTIKALGKKDADVFIENNKGFIPHENKKIIIPLSKIDGRKSFLELPYYEKH